MQACPQLARRHSVTMPIVPLWCPISVFGERLIEFRRHDNSHIHMLKMRTVPLVEEKGDVGMRQAQRNGRPRCAVACAPRGVDRCSPGRQRRQVDANTTRPRHDIGHLHESGKKGITSWLRIKHWLLGSVWDERIFAQPYDVTVIVRDLIIRTGAGEDAAAGDELEIPQQLVELVRPFSLLLRRWLDASNSSGHALPHQLRICFQRHPMFIFERVAILEDLVLKPFESGLMRGLPVHPRIAARCPRGYSRCHTNSSYHGKM